ncbi:hypothetical protein XENORESO_021984 [Xenotaenia resolanae]|uniref:Uncharacterized protein n=1 Tax=Xenotaenia resolanae TaxID=208358 RepID=A0ABV0W659_9TELE
MFILLLNCKHKIVNNVCFFILGLFKSTAMKLFLIAALLVLALTHGSFAQDGAEQMSQYLQNIKAKINQDFQEFVGHQELKDQAE